MVSFDVPQWIIVAYLAAVVIGSPVLRSVMIRHGATGFVSWRDFWTTWTGDFIIKAALVGVLFWGGFWS